MLGRRGDVWRTLAIVLAGTVSWQCGDDATVETTTGTTTMDQGVVPTCSEYCAAMATTCPDEAFYAEDKCLTWCSSEVAPISMGTTADDDVDTLGCRMHWLEKAEAEGDAATRADQCAFAGASGGNQCGTFCDVYCRQGVATCSAANADYPANRPTYFDEDPAADPAATCAAACTNFSTDVLDGVSQTEQHFGYGNTVQCRLHHQQAAIIEGQVQQPSAYALHCGHAAIEPTELCTDDAEPNAINYCEFALAFCPELLPAGTDANACRMQLNNLIMQGIYEEAGFASFTDTDVNSVGCLNHWIMKAPVDASACGAADFDPQNWQQNGGAGRCQAR